MRLVWTDLDNTEIRKMIDEGPDFTHEEWLGSGLTRPNDEPGDCRFFDPIQEDDGKDNK